MSNNPLDKETIESASAAAAIKPHEFNAKERVVYIKKMVNLVFEYKQQRMAKGDILDRVPEFAEAFPHLFNSIVDDASFDATNLNMMINLLEKMDTGSLSQHQASMIVGDRLLKKYYKGGAPP